MAGQQLWARVGGLILGGLAVLVILVSSCSTVNRTLVAPPEIEGAAFVGNKTCADCHTNICRIFPVSPHARVLVAGLAMPELTGCESCHGPASKHVQAGGGRGKFIVNPGRDPAACFRCHFDIEAEFHLPQHHPVLEGHMNCVQCHDPHGRDIMKPAAGLAMARQNETCAPCHRDQSRPFVFEHPALREGCVTCHAPHASVNPKLLRERDVNMCLKCHAQIQGPATSGNTYIGQVIHTQFLRMGTCWSSGCHTAVHGSNMSRQLLY